ncbi:dienelactone hydrolase family protein [bacterium]|nr:dienelactone hydrolase family protein [bacterium]
MKALVAAVAFGLTGTAAMAGCGEDPAPCTLPGGEYHIALPDNPKGAPVVMFLHGAGSNGANALKNTAMVEAFRNRGYAVLAPSAVPRRAGADGGFWNFFPGWDGRDEPQFLRETVRAASTQFATSDTRVLMTGFSAGAFMVSYLACAEPASFPAYAPLAGTFWQPHPSACAGPVKLFQTHGWRDSTVPLEGRPLRNGDFLQGDVFASLETWRRANACPRMSPDSYQETGVFWRRAWSACAEGSALELALHPGGHIIPQGWPDMILDWFEEQVP